MKLEARPREKNSKRIDEEKERLVRESLAFPGMDGSEYTKAKTYTARRKRFAATPPLTTKSITFVDWR